MSRHRLMIYSHDSFGLGHLRRCRSIAMSLTTRDPELSVMIVSGLPLIARYDFHPRISITLVPEIIKLHSGDYRPLSKAHDLSDAIEERSSIIRDTARGFEPDLFLVDKEPLGIRGEVAATLHYLRDKNVPMILGLRDVMDDPALLAAEWKRKQAVEAIEEFYSEIWIYGLPDIYDPLMGIELSPAAKRRILYTGYLNRSDVDSFGHEREVDGCESPFLLVTPGGGGDGIALIDWVLKAVEHRRTTGAPPIDHDILIVSGPFMDADTRAGFETRIAALPNVRILDFVPGMERLIMRAAGIVAMGGYNTFCEILSFDKPALLVPRTQPRKEQIIRASRAEALGLIAVLVDDELRDPVAMGDALHRLPTQRRPSSVVIPHLLNGHDIIADRVAVWLGAADQTASGQTVPFPALRAGLGAGE